MRVSAQTAYGKGQFAARRERLLARNTIVVTDTGADNLTAAVPANVEPLYALIRQKGVNPAPLADRTSH